jgi:hypothetical protein
MRLSSINEGSLFNDQMQERTVMSRGIGRSGGTIAVFSIACIIGAGCSQKDSGLRGTYGLVSLNGKPLEKGNISFEPVDLKQGSVSGGMIASGKYRVPTDKGLKPGKYRVRISAPDFDNPAKLKRTRDIGPMSSSSGTDIPGELIPKKYNTQSEEIVEVEKSGRNQFDFKIEKE